MVKITIYGVTVKTGGALAPIAPRFRYLCPVHEKGSGYELAALKVEPLHLCNSCTSGLWT